jgi:hypothetical protein
MPYDAEVDYRGRTESLRRAARRVAQKNVYFMRGSPRELPRAVAQGFRLKCAGKIAS